MSRKHFPLNGWKIRWFRDCERSEFSILDGSQFPRTSFGIKVTGSDSLKKIACTSPQTSEEAVAICDRKNIMMTQGRGRDTNKGRDERCKPPVISIIWKIFELFCHEEVYLHFFFVILRHKNIKRWILNHIQIYDRS